MLRAEKRKARSGAVAKPAPQLKSQQSRPPPDAATAALDTSRPRPALQVLPGAPPTIAYAADWISEAEEAAIVAAAKRGDDWVTVRGRRLRRLGGPAGEIRSDCGGGVCAVGFFSQARVFIDWVEYNTSTRTVPTSATQRALYRVPAQRRRLAS